MSFLNSIQTYAHNSSEHLKFSTEYNNNNILLQLCILCDAYNSPEQ